MLFLIVYLGGGFKHFLFSPLFEEDEPILTHIFQMGWFNHQPATRPLFFLGGGIFVGNRIQKVPILGCNKSTL